MGWFDRALTGAALAVPAWLLCAAARGGAGVDAVRARVCGRCPGSRPKRPCWRCWLRGWYGSAPRGRPRRRRAAC